MPWVRLDDSFGDDPRAATAGATAVGVLVLALCYSNRNLTDGWVPESIVRRSLAGSAAETTEEIIAALLQSGLLAPAEREVSGYQIHSDYVGLQPTRAKVLKRRDQRTRLKAEAGRLGGINSGRARTKQKQSMGEAEPGQPPSMVEAPIPIPIPSGKSTGAAAPVSQDDNKATHGLLCRLFNEVMDNEGSGSSATDRKEEVKMLCAKRNITWTPDALGAALDTVLKVRELREAVPQRSRVAPGWTRANKL